MLLSRWGWIEYAKLETVAGSEKYKVVCEYRRGTISVYLLPISLPKTQTITKEDQLTSSYNSAKQESNYRSTPPSPPTHTHKIF